jgi:hypothetical protein
MRVEAPIWIDIGHGDVPAHRATTQRHQERFAQVLGGKTPQSRSPSSYMGQLWLKLGTKVIGAPYSY